MAAALSSCDPGFDEHCLVHNGSGHDVTFVALDTNTWMGRHRAEGVLIKKDSSYLVAQDGGIGSASLEGAQYNVVRDAYGDSVKLIFDDGRSIVYRADKDTLDGFFCFDSEDRYEYSELLNTGRFFHGYAYYGELVYHILPRDYEAAE